MRIGEKCNILDKMGIFKLIDKGSGNIYTFESETGKKITYIYQFWNKATMSYIINKHILPIKE